MNLAEQLSSPAEETPILRVDMEATNIINLSEQGLVVPAPTSRDDFPDHFNSPLNEW